MFPVTEKCPQCFHISPEWCITIECLGAEPKPPNLNVFYLKTTASIYFHIDVNYKSLIRPYTYV